ncbi:hypothetical protein OHS33_20005 [Streptomyces sp. NBC_00536]|uniref:hypothetical protein n=1 Tax=Streptomyces sp. NBC_00536 TaxID=2975769 RepID=UPI002E7FBE63|nr:hypothetical protein [Streptomyces sp. NBC_00536]WUC80405.1 hypothetical protein OHS33_20005 [Streptomyces sp. NBC_00536]
MPFETDLAHALNRTTDSLEPDLTALVGGAVQRGRSRRRRRNAGITAGVGACAALAVGALMLPGMLSGAFPGTFSTGSDMEPAALALPRSAVSGDQMIAAVEQSLPGGRFSEKTGQSNNPADPSAGYVANGGMAVDDGHGVAYVGVSALRLKLPLRDGDGLNCEEKRTPKRAKGDTCELRELPSSAAVPGGALVMWEKTAAEQPVRADTAHRWTMTVTLKATGAQVQMVQWNSPGGGTGGGVFPKATRPAPPLSEEQAEAALTGAVWAPVLGAVG